MTAALNISDDQYKPLILKEQTRLLFEHLPFVLIGSLVSATGVAVILWNEVAHSVLLGWTALVYLLCLARWKIRQYFMRLGTDYDANRWIHVATALTALAGLLWG
ncbi:MAG TPA: hypothetical protein DCX50_06525, partial [Limnobacter sp.]|nr:hypothetical protein [Limnobacter sp.]